MKYAFVALALTAASMALPTGGLVSGTVQGVNDLVGLNKITTSAPLKREALLDGVTGLVGGVTDTLDLNKLTGDSVLRRDAQVGNVGATVDGLTGSLGLDAVKVGDILKRNPELVGGLLSTVTDTVDLEGVTGTVSGVTDTVGLGQGLLNKRAVEDGHVVSGVVSDVNSIVGVENLLSSHPLKREILSLLNSKTADIDASSILGTKLANANVDAAQLADAGVHAKRELLGGLVPHTTEKLGLGQVGNVKRGVLKDTVAGVSGDVDETLANIKISGRGLLSNVVDPVADDLNETVGGIAIAQRDAEIDLSALNQEQLASIGLDLSQIQTADLTSEQKSSLLSSISTILSN